MVLVLFQRVPSFCLYCLVAVDLHTLRKAEGSCRQAGEGVAEPRVEFRGFIINKQKLWGTVMWHVVALYLALPHNL